MDVRRIDLERARREAKALLAAARAGEPEARARIAAVPGELKLATAQLALARELGERSWPALVRRAELESATTRERAEAFVRAATSDRIDHADALLERDPAIARTLPAAALVLGEPVSVNPLLPLEPLGWLPLVYVAHSRYLGGARTDALVASAERLLDAGADPNGAYTHEEFGEQSALYGAAGIAHEPRLTRLLLDRGANPDDHESLYHATESRDTTCVRLLLEAGATVSGTNALAHALDREDMALVELLLEHGPPAGEPWVERDVALSWAIFRNRSAPIVRLLVERGADLEAPDDHTGRKPYAHAVARGRADLVELLEGLGAAPDGERRRPADRRVHARRSRRGARTRREGSRRRRGGAARPRAGADHRGRRGTRRGDGAARRRRRADRGARRHGRRAAAPRCVERPRRHARPAAAPRRRPTGDLGPADEQHPARLGRARLALRRRARRRLLRHRQAPRARGRRARSRARGCRDRRALRLARGARGRAGAGTGARRRRLWRALLAGGRRGSAPAERRSPA